ncbi:MAG TPA: glycosyl hydrolase family 65 protein [Jatrophihabitans sp.]|nr:glycosyl hydrolase family 65 protein [Jatrophihabitans sp.]
MTEQRPRYPAEPWQVREIGLSWHTLAQSESLFALSNGHIGVRGNLDEGDPNGLPGTYLNSFYESRPLPYAETGFGYPESGQTVLNVTNGKLIRLLVDDEPFDLRYGHVAHHERILDLRRGVLRRHVEWVSPAGKRIRVHSTRLVSLARRSVVAIHYAVEPVDDEVRIVVQSELVANEPVPAQSDDPRVAAVIEHALEPVLHESNEHRAHLLHRTRSSGLQLAVGMQHEVNSPQECVSEMAAHPNWARFTVSTRLDPDQRFELAKFVSYGWSGTRSAPALRDQVDAALLSAAQAGWAEVEQEQHAHFADFWHGADVEIDGDPRIQQAVRFGIFHVYQAAARAEQRAIPAKGLTGPGYDGHAFWDTEMFVLPVLTATAAHAAADALHWRKSTLQMAVDRARTLRLRGAAFPWRTIRGEECSAYWPAGTAALHVNADISSAATRYVRWTGDDIFERDCALPLLVETARLWQSLGYFGGDERFHIDGVTGPDEYTAVIDDNTYTNLMAQHNLNAAVAAVRRWPEAAAALDVDDDEASAWARAAECMAVPYNPDARVHEQDRGFTARARWDFERSARDGEYPLLMHVPYFDLYRKQVVKQADLVLAMHWADYAFTPDEKARNFAYYDPLTVRDSSLSAATQAVLAAEVGHLDLAAEYLTEAALMDLLDLERNAKDGLHIASLAGGWLALVAGFGGMRDSGAHLRFRPQLPPAWERLRFSVRYLGSRIHVQITDGAVTYRSSGQVTIVHDGGEGAELLELEAEQEVERAWKPVQPRTPRPTQPAGREVHSAPPA